MSEETPRQWHGSSCIGQRNTRSCRATLQQFLKGIADPCSWICGTGSGPTPSLFWRTKNELLMWNLDRFQHTQGSRLSASCWQLTLIFFSLQWCRNMLLYIHREKWMEGPDLQITPNLLKWALRSDQCLPTRSVAPNCIDRGELPSWLRMYTGNTPANTPGKDRTRIPRRKLSPLQLSRHWQNSPKAYCLSQGSLRGCLGRGDRPSLL